MRALRGVALILCLSAIASAEPAPDDKHIAQDAFRDGTRLYDLADFKDALEAFKKAYFHFEDPAFLFNIAQCYRQLGNSSESIRFYKT
jgi:tetratricopeptide (TPR) repeat protein